MTPKKKEPTPTVTPKTAPKPKPAPVTQPKKTVDEAYVTDFIRTFFYHSGVQAIPTSDAMINLREFVTKELTNLSR